MVFEDKDLCRECGGNCCNTMGCHYAPTDFSDLSYDGLKTEIEKGHISIDWWEGNPFKDDREISRAYFLRVRNNNEGIVNGSWGGRCSLLTKTGCPLEFNNRPKGGRELIPIKDGVCRESYTKMDCAKDWFKYNSIIIKLVEEYKTENSIKYSIEDLMKMFLNL